MQGADDPDVRQFQAGQRLLAGEVGGRQLPPLGVRDVLQVHEDELGGVPELVGEVAVSRHPLQAQVQVLPRSRACKRSDVASGNSKSALQLYVAV